MPAIPSPLDTIAAIATPVGEGALAILRISGTRALEIASAVFKPALHSLPPNTAPSHSIHYGHAIARGRVIDEVLLSVFRAPRTATREDVVEISCHGSVLIARTILDALLAAGARPAEPGEFTRRAFLNGRIDLTQAEAVADLIHARTDLAAAAAMDQLSGHLSRTIESLRESLLEILAHCEAHIDFPDDDLTPDSLDAITHRLERLATTMGTLLATARDGHLLRHGIRIAIVGLPNAGKSSLLNRLLGHDRAIVSHEPGTTRDTLEESAQIRGIPIVFIDTAGIRESQSAAEEEGVRRGRDAASQADLLLHVIDASVAPDALHPQPFPIPPGARVIHVLNKCDLLPLQPASPTPRESAAILATVRISCHTGEGMESLKSEIESWFWAGRPPVENPGIAINDRHRDALRRAHEGVLRSIQTFRSGLSLEFAALDLRVALGAVDEVTGRDGTEAVLDAIFKRFCIGK